MSEDTSTFTTKKQGLPPGNEFKWGGDGASWEEEVTESNGFGMKNGNVTIARPPEAAINVDVSTGDLDTTFSFDASGTTDPSDTSLSYEWDLGNGETKTGTGATMSHSYGTVDSFTVTVTATNEYENTDTASITVTVESRSHDATISIDPTTGNTETAFLFDASDSTDPDGSTLTYDWNFGDGASATGETASHSFTDPGDYTVELIVTDEYGNTGTEITTVTVDSTAPDGIAYQITADNLSMNDGEVISTWPTSVGSPNVTMTGEPVYRSTSFNNLWVLSRLPQRTVVSREVIQHPIRIVE